jgi:NTE family protein
LIGLVLSGGGARGAYQAGVLQAISEIAQSQRIQRPFQIFSGVSAGAINTAYLAAGAESFSLSTKNLVQLWSNISSEQVFYTDAVHLGKIGLKWMGELSFGGLTGTTPGKALLDTSPLRELLINNLAFSQIQDNIDKGFIHATSVTAVDYQTSTAITFVQGQKNLPTWQRSRRLSENAILSADHIMASSAIPMLFPPIKVKDRYFGDGCVRNMAPCSPAIHLGATKLIVVGVRRQTTDVLDFSSAPMMAPPSVAKVFNVLLNAVLLDGVELDIERLKRINDFIKQVPKNASGGISFKPVEYVWIHPSEDLGLLAREKAHKLPKVIRYLLKGLGPLEDAAEIISYLMFEKEFTQKLIEIGYEDGIKQKESIIELLTSN